MQSEVQTWFTGAHYSDLSVEQQELVFKQLPDIESKIQFCRWNIERNIHNNKVSMPYYCTRFKSVYEQQVAWIEANFRQRDGHHVRMAKIETILELSLHEEKVIRAQLLLKEESDHLHTFQHCLQLLLDVHTRDAAQGSQPWLDENTILHYFRIALSIEVHKNKNERIRYSILGNVREIITSIISQDVSNALQRKLLLYTCELFHNAYQDTENTLNRVFETIGSTLLQMENPIQKVLAMIHT